MSPSAASPPVMQAAGRPPPYRVYDAAVSNVRTKPMGFLAVAGCCPHTAVCSCRVSGVLSPEAGVVVINSSTGLYADPAFNSVSVFALHRRLKRAVCCSFGLGALRQSCFSCSLCAASSVSPCAVALAVGADLLWALLAVRMPLTVWAASRSGWLCLYSAASSGPYPCRLHAPAGSR